MRSVSAVPVARENLTPFSSRAPEPNTFGSRKGENTYTTEHGGANRVARQEHVPITRHRHAEPTVKITRTGDQHSPGTNPRRPPRSGPRRSRTPRPAPGRAPGRPRGR